MTDAEIREALDAMAEATTESELMDRLWRAHDLGATWKQCREAYEKYERRTK